MSKHGNSYELFAIILIKDIAGRRKARQLEDEFVESFRSTHGHYPPGNPRHKKYKGG